MKKLIAIVTLMAVLLTSLPDVSVKAVNLPYTITTIGDTVLNTMLNDLKTRKSSWFMDFKYLIYKYNGYYYIMLVNRKATSQVVVWDQTLDADNDLDKIGITYSCNTTVVCYQYAYNATTGAYNTSYAVTTPVTEQVLASNDFNYTNIDQVLKYWDWDDDYSYYVPWYTSLGSYYSYGIPNIPTSNLIATGNVAASTDQVQTDQLIEANWGAMNWLRDGLNGLFADLEGWINTLKLVLLAGLGTVLDPIGDVLSGLFIPSQQFINDLYPRYAEPITLKLGFLWYPFEWFGGLVTSITGSTVTGTFTFGNLFGAPLKLDMTGFKNGAPQVWNFVLLLIRGTLSYDLISGFYYEVTSKMKGTS